MEGNQHKDKLTIYKVKFNFPGENKKGIAIYTGDDTYRVFWETNEVSDLPHDNLFFYEESMPIKDIITELHREKNNGILGGKRRIQKSRHRKLNKHKHTLRKYK